MKPTKRKFIILLSGKQGSGKTTLANLLQAQLNSWSNIGNHGGYARHYIFAGAIYKMHNYCINVIEKHGFKRDIPKDGKLLQLLGTEWGREYIDPDIWVKIMKSQIDKVVETSWANLNFFIISDCRFKNEFNFFEGEDVLKIRLNAPTAVRKIRCSNWRENDLHPSEIDLDEYDTLGVFDKYFSTHEKSAETIATEIRNYVITEMVKVF